MAWIELHQSLPQNKKTLRLMSILKIDMPQAVGHLCMLWLWALDNVEDGSLEDTLDSEIALIAGWKKKPNVFVDALISAGFIDDDRHIHDWYDYAGKLIDKRKSDAERKRTSRTKTDKSERTPNGHPTDIQRTDDGKGADVAGNRTVPNLTVPFTNKYTTHSNLPTPIILRVAGIKNRGPSVAEEEFEKKCQDRGCGEDMIRLAYDITIKATGEYKVQYMAAIMERWHSEGIHTIEQAKQDTESRRKKGTSYSSETFDHDDFFQAALKRG